MDEQNNLVENFYFIGDSYPSDHHISDDWIGCGESVKHSQNAYKPRDKPQRWMD